MYSYVNKGKQSGGIKWRKADRELKEELEVVSFRPYKLLEQKTAFEHSFSRPPIGVEPITSSTGGPMAFGFPSILKFKCEKVPFIDCNLSTSAVVRK